MPRRSPRAWATAMGELHRPGSRSTPTRTSPLTRADWDRATGRRPGPIAGISATGGLPPKVAGTDSPTRDGTTSDGTLAQPAVPATPLIPSSRSRRHILRNKAAISAADIPQPRSHRRRTPRTSSGFHPTEAFERRRNASMDPSLRLLLGQGPTLIPAGAVSSTDPPARSRLDCSDRRVEAETACNTAHSRSIGRRRKRRLAFNAAWFSRRVAAIAAS